LLLHLVGLELLLTLDVLLQLFALILQLSRQLCYVGVLAVDHLYQLRFLVDHLHAFLVLVTLVDHVGLV